MPIQKKFTFDGTKVGDRFIWSPLSDVYSYSVIKIISPKKILLQEDKCLPAKFNEHGGAVPDLNGSTLEISARKSRKSGEYSWKRVGSRTKSRPYHRTTKPYCYYDPHY